MDRDDFEEYAAARWRHLVHAGVLLGCSFSEAEDLAQATLLRCFVAWPKVTGAANRDAYVTKVLVNGFRASRRRRWWSELPVGELPEASSADDVTLEWRDAVERALGSLSTGQREVVTLRYWCHLTESEIAAALGVAVGTVKSRLSRAVALLATNAHVIDLVDPGGTP